MGPAWVAAQKAKKEAAEAKAAADAKVRAENEAEATAKTKKIAEEAMAVVQPNATNVQTLSERGLTPYQEFLEAEPPPIVHSEYQKSLFVGDLMSMTHRSVRALSPQHVVMCYAHPEVGGACRASLAKPESVVAPSDASASDSRLLPPLAWDTPEIFYKNETGRLETVRLNSHRFVVCFERVSDNVVACTLAFLQENPDKQTLASAFGNSLDFGNGRLVTSSPAQAGKQLVVCFAPKARSRGDVSDVSCKWADVVDLVGQDVMAELRWAKDATQNVQTV